MRFIYTKRTTFCLALLITCVLSFPTNSNSTDWPQWQGPDRTAFSQETGLLKEWPEAGPALAWKKTEIGTGYGGPSIANGRIFGISNRGENQVVWALSEETGEELWATTLGPVQSGGMPQGIEGPGCTPTVDQDQLYVLGHGGELACLNVENGEFIWSKHLINDFGGVLPVWRYNESPLIDGEKLICTPGGEDATMVALNKQTGELIWKSLVPAPNNQDSSERGRGRRGGFQDSGAAYSSAIVVNFDGLKQYVQFTSKALVGVDASDGTLLWRYDNPANNNGINCSTPIYNDGHVFASSAYGAGGGLSKLSKNDDGKITADEVWFSKDMENHHGGVILIDNSFYGANGGNGGGFLVCLDYETGNVLWNQRDERGLRKGSIAFADDRIYYRTEDGTVLLIEPSREECLIRGSFDQPDRTRQPAWTHPIIANGKLYIRDQETLYCYDIKSQE